MPRHLAVHVGSVDSAVAYNQPVTHGEQLTVNDVGPWALQAVPKGSESLDTVTVPGRGYWLISEADEWRPNQAYVYNNNPANKGGIVPVGGLTIDGYTVPAGTNVAQFRDLSGSDFSAQGQGGNYLFRGCRFRNNAVGQSSQFNDFTATYTNRLHYCDMGSISALDVDYAGAFWKAIGGSGHVVHRTYFSYQYVTFQPNVPDCSFIENYVHRLIYYGGDPALGDPGFPGGGGAAHMACIGCEGGGTGYRVLRNYIVPECPDDGGHVFNNGSVMAFENTNLLPYDDVWIKDNYLSGMNYVILDMGEVAGSTNIEITGNKITTRYFTLGGATGTEQAGPVPVPWGSNGNVKSGNIWADDYGTGGDGNTPTSSRQYPTGNGPRVGTTAF